EPLHDWRRFGRPFPPQVPLQGDMATQLCCHTVALAFDLDEGECPRLHANPSPHLQDRRDAGFVTDAEAPSAALHDTPTAARPTRCEARPGAGRRRPGGTR